MDDAAARLLIPTEELNRYLRAVVEAMDELRASRREAGREVLRQGLYDALLSRAQPWGGALVRLWVRALQSYDAGIW